MKTAGDTQCSRNTQQLFLLIGAFFMIVVMLFASRLTGQIVIVFPEIAALLVGIWVSRDPKWGLNKPLHLWAIPTLFSLLGVGVNDLPWLQVYKLLGVLIVTVCLLHLLRSNVAAGVSAGLLPVVINIHSLVFVASVFVMTFILMVVTYRLSPPDLNKMPVKFRNPRDTFVYTCVIAIWIGLCAITGFQMGLIPPVFVAMFGVFHLELLAWRVHLKHAMVLILTAFVAVIIKGLMPESIVWVGTLNVLAAWTINRTIKIQVPTSYGIALMPLLFSGWSSWSFPVAVLVVLAVLLLAVGLLKNIQKKIFLKKSITAN